jgi:hypothetical protein
MNKKQVYTSVESISQHCYLKTQSPAGFELAGLYRKIIQQ